MVFKQYNTFLTPSVQVKEEASPKKAPLGVFSFRERNKFYQDIYENKSSDYKIKNAHLSVSSIYLIITFSSLITFLQ
ncbi:hypothetical protein EXW45_05130 [Bacillus wiedmannii]|nr:hypothetical protein DN394_21175 [Bacillus sp. BB081]QWH70792.1 hypothetical protein EXW45_05130 [Bacillus wiedmannii]